MNLNDIRAQQQNHLQTASDARLTAFLAGMDTQTARLDLCPVTSVEARMVARSQGVTHALG